MRGAILILLVLNIALGIGIGLMIQEVSSFVEKPMETAAKKTSFEVPSPFNHVRENQISVEDGKVVIDLSGEEVGWSRYTDSNSMDQTLDDGHNGIEIKPKSSKDIYAGDIIAFRYGKDLVVHRVVEIGNDAEGWYAKTKGDNNAYVDPGKRRFKDIERLTVGIIF